VSVPAVSVITAAYNGAALIEETLASLTAQTFTDFEIVVVDDKSTDDTLAVLRRWDDPRLRVIEAEVNGGPVRARNRAVAAARGRYLAALDQDDLCLPERLAKQVAHLDAHPETVLVGTAIGLLKDGVVQPSNYPAHTTPALIRWLLLLGNPLAWSTVMVRADAARRLTPFTDPDRRYAEDFDLYHRLKGFGAIARLDEELVLYRLHGDNASIRYEATMTANAYKVLRDAYRPILGADTEVAAELVVAHVVTRRPVPDRDTLARLGALLVRLQTAHFQAHPVSQDDHKLIRWETARRWAAVVRASLRTGSITLADALAVRPDHLGLGHAGIDELLWSSLIGAVRAKRRA
jgi:glycosyltransferase involved in cell wall biosynthesis